MPAPFPLLASHPALDFVNTLDDRFLSSGPLERLSEYADLIAFAEQSALLNSQQISALRKSHRSAQASTALARAYDLRDALSSAFYGVTTKGKAPFDSLKRIEAYSLVAQSHRRLVWTQMGARDEELARAEWVWECSKGAIDLALWAITESAVGLLTSHALSKVHECASPTCRWLFLDTSKNHSRRWCDMTICGNRMKARRFKARL